MHIYFSGIGGTAIGPLALIAKQAGYSVSGSDAADSQYISYLRSKGIDDISISQSRDHIASAHASHPIDWLVYSSALPKTDPDHPELVFCRENGIKATRRDDLLIRIIKDKNLKLVAIAGTHGKTTTTAMAVWVFKQLGLPISYSVGAKLSYGEMGQYQEGSSHFVYEADEFDRNFLSFHPEISLITGVDWDHPDIYPTRDSYNEAFREFIGQSRRTFIWKNDAEQLALKTAEGISVLDQEDPGINNQIKLAGRVNRLDAWLVAHGLADELKQPVEKLLNLLSNFPGVSRRFEKLAPNLYTDYAHTPPKIRGALQLAREVAGDNVVVIYEGLHNTRQHFIKDELADLFNDVKQLYIVPSYLAREDKNLEILTPEKIVNMLSNSAKEKAGASQLDDALKQSIRGHLDSSDLVLCLSAGGAGSLDEWLRKEFT
jgi:UDP-N-acetylmuramate--alanine ligase